MILTDIHYYLPSECHQLSQCSDVSNPDQTMREVGWLYNSALANAQSYSALMWETLDAVVGQTSNKVAEFSNVRVAFLGCTAFASYLSRRYSAFQVFSPSPGIPQDTIGPWVFSALGAIIGVAGLAATGPIAPIALPVAGSLMPLVSKAYTTLQPSNDPTALAFTKFSDLSSQWGNTGITMKRSWEASYQVLWHRSLPDILRGGLFVGSYDPPSFEATTAWLATVVYVKLLGKAWAMDGAWVNRIPYGSGFDAAGCASWSDRLGENGMKQCTDDAMLVLSKFK